MSVKKACIALSVLALITDPARATTAWEDGRAYTAILEDTATVAAAAVGAAAAAAAAAAADVVRAQRAVAAAGGTAVATTAATLAQLASAEAALATATATLAAAEAAAVATAAAVAAAAVGTYTGQGLRGLWDWCWDPVCNLTSAVPSGPTYVPWTEAELEAILPELVDVGTSGVLSLSADDFRESGVSPDFILEGASLFIGAAQGAAAATAGRQDIVNQAITDLQAGLVDYRVSIADFAQTLPSYAFESPAADLAAAMADLEAAVGNVLAVCDVAGGDDCDAIDALLDEALTEFGNAQARFDAIASYTLVGQSNALFPPLSIVDFETFLERTAMIGAQALPLAEIDLSQHFLTLSETFFPDTSVGNIIAAYDAKGLTEGREASLFDPVTGLITLDELLFGSATILSDKGPWLNIDLRESPLAAAVPIPPSGPLLAFALVALLRRRRLGMSIH